MKHSQSVRRLTVALAMVLGSVTLAQAVPARISFPGRLASGGGPADGTYQLTFALFDAPAGGTRAWTEPQSLGVVSGLLSAELGAVNPLTPEVFNGAQLYLEVSVESTVLSPRLAIDSVPYAIRAGVATVCEHLGPLFPGDVVDRSGDQSIGGRKHFSSPIEAEVIGNASTVTDGVYSTGSYANPAWLTSLDGAKITGKVANAASADSVGGALSGDVTGTQSATKVVSIQGVAVAATTPGNGDVLTYDPGGAQWRPAPAITVVTNKSSTGSVPALTSTPQFIGPTVSVTVKAGQAGLFTLHTGLFSSSATNQQVWLNVCAQPSGGTLADIAGTDVYAYTPPEINKHGMVSMSTISTFSAAGTYTVGICAATFGVAGGGGEGSAEAILFQ
jgi:hypothetical protein